MLPLDNFKSYLLYEKNYSKKTVINYEIDLLQLEEFLKNNYGEFQIEEVKAEHVREWLMSLVEHGLNVSTVNTKLSSLRTYFHFLLSTSVIKSNPMTMITGSKKKKSLPVFLRESEMNKLLDDVEFDENFEGVRDKLILELFYSTGIRLSELIGLDDSSVDFSSSQIKVTGKRNKQRIIPFGPELAKSMKDYMELRNLVIPRQSKAFFVRKNGLRLYAVLVSRVVKRYVSLVTTASKKSPHVLRHTFATQMLNHDADLNTIKELLGHESVATTQVYTHTTFEELKKAYKQAHPRG